MKKCTDRTHRAMYYKGYREGFKWSLTLALALLEVLWVEVSDEDKPKVQKVIDSLGI